MSQRRIVFPGQNQNESGIFKNGHHICEQLRYKRSTNVCCVCTDKCEETLDSLQTCSGSSKHTRSVQTEPAARSSCISLVERHVFLIII